MPKFKNNSQVEKYITQRVESLFTKLSNEVASVGMTLELNDDGSFNIKDHPGAATKINRIVKNIQDDFEVQMINGVNLAWETANQNTSLNIEELFGKKLKKMSPERRAKYFSNNPEAREAFLGRKNGGLALSSGVWNNKEFKNQIADSIEVCLYDGKTPAQMSRAVRSYLKEPNKLFRRVRDKNGKLKLSKAAKEYHPGAGVYRSSYKNAMRLARTETNMAYHTADYLRWQQMDFVVGIEVRLSNNHNCVGIKPGHFFDICDELKGKYPKDFKFVGWHPHCRCHAVPIFKTDEEFDRDEKRILEGKNPINKSKNKVREMPKQFGQWVTDNKERVAKASSLPYFIRDNAKLIDGITIPKALQPQVAQATLIGDVVAQAATPKVITKTPLEIAEERHAARTPEQAAEIRDAWEARVQERERITKMAMNVVNVAAEYPEVNTTTLQQLLSKSKFTAAKDEARKVAKEIAAVRKDEKMLSVLIPDVHQWKKQFSSAELHAVYDAVEKKLTQLKSLSLQEQAKKLDFEIKYVADPGKYKAGAIKYPTWKVSQDAYTKQYKKVLEDLEWENIKTLKSDLWTSVGVKTKSKKFIDNFHKLEAAIAAKDKSIAQKILGELNIQKTQLEKAATRRANKKTAQGVSFGDECFTQERKDKAKYFRRPDEANDYFHDNAVDTWAKANSEERSAVVRYTTGSAYITEPLRAVKGYYYSYTTRINEFRKDCDAMTRYISRSSFKDDVWIKRDENSSIFGSVWGLDLDNFKNNPSALVGKIGTDKSFLSCGSNRGTRFTGTGVRKDVIYNFYCPKGTMATYAEPFNRYGEFRGNWDGKTKASYLNENEIILQRGTTMRITKAEYDKTKRMWYIDVDIIAQNAREIADVVIESGGFYAKLK